MWLVGFILQVQRAAACTLYPRERIPGALLARIEALDWRVGEVYKRGPAATRSLLRDCLLRRLRLASPAQDPIVIASTVAPSPKQHGPQLLCVMLVPHQLRGLLLGSASTHRRTKRLPSAEAEVVRIKGRPMVRRLVRRLPRAALLRLRWSRWLRSKVEKG